MPVLLDYFDRHRPEELIGQTAAIHFALVPLLLEATGVPFQLTIGWCIRAFATASPSSSTTRTLCDASSPRSSTPGTVRACRFICGSHPPACEILDVTFAMNLGWARNREECAQHVIYRSAHAPKDDPIYHPMLVGPDFFRQTGAVI